MDTLYDIVKADVVALAPELTLTDQAWVDILNYVNELDLTSLGESTAVTRLARIYLAAHFGTAGRQATTGGGAAVSGAVIQESAGGIMRKYASAGGSSSTTVVTASMESTMYGQLYMRIIGVSAARMPLVV